MSKGRNLRCAGCRLDASVTAGTLLKRRLLGTRQGAVRPEHLDDYLAEFAFRFNRRSSTHCGLLFYRLLEQAVQLDHVPLATITGNRA